MSFTRLSGQGAGLATRLSPVEFQAATTNTVMGDHLWEGKPPQYFNEPPKPNQPPPLSGMGNEYQPKCGDALWLEVKGRYDSFHLWINA